MLTLLGIGLIGFITSAFGYFVGYSYGFRDGQLNERRRFRHG